MQYSFYGGAQGKNFEISKVFPNKIEMMKDLMMNWASPIAQGELVLISYGMPNVDSPSYRQNADLDKNAYGRCYNSTLWQKIYTEYDLNQTEPVAGIETEYISENYGLGYKLVAVLTGNTPVIDVETITENADYKDMKVDLDYTNMDYPVITFHLPQSQVLQLGDTIILDANQKPDVAFNEDNINEPVITFSIPQAQKLINDHITFNVLNANQEPTFKWEEDGTNADGTKQVNQPYVTIELPQSQTLQYAKGTDFTVLNADEDPDARLDFEIEGINKPHLKLALPQSQVMKIRPAITVAPRIAPFVEYDDEGAKINEPEIQFYLPRAVQFMYGTLLGKYSAGSYTLNVSGLSEDISSLAVGDYYINKNTGFIYQVTAVESEGDPIPKRTFTYMACLAAPAPTVSARADVPYYIPEGETEYKSKTPTITSGYADPIEHTGWRLTFGLPKFPDLKATIELKEPETTPTIDGKITGESEFTYNFELPRYSKFFTGTEVDRNNLNAAIAGAAIGDYYLNTNFGEPDDGKIYKLTASGWIEQGSIKGDVGNPLNIIKTVNITPDDGIVDSLPAVSNYLAGLLGSTPKAEEIVAVNYIGGDGKITSYWYFHDGTDWGRVQLTGATGNLIQKTYDSTDEEDKAYSVKYTNGLLIKSTQEVLTSEREIHGYSVAALENLMSWGSFYTDESENKKLVDSLGRDI